MSLLCPWLSSLTRVLPLHKKKSKEIVENYRPVSILPTPSKVLEEILRSQLTKFLEGKGILPPTQFGFRSSRSTVEATAAALHDWRRARRKNRACGALQFDLSAAFDVISPELLVQKLQVYGAGRNVRSLISSYLSGRRQRVDYGGTSSSVVDVTVGSPQGSCLSPLLYVTLVADLDEWISGGTIVAYADDTTIYCEGQTKEEVREVLEKAAKEILLFFQATSLAANASKTKFIMFGRHKEKPIMIGNTLIEESGTEELLGFTYNKALNWKDQLSKMEKELRKRIGILRRLTWHLPHKVVTEMIEPIFTSKLRYGIALICNCFDKADVGIKKLHGLHRGAMKASLRLGSRHHPSDNELLRKTGQRSVREMVVIATANMAWKAGKNWKEHPLTGNRIEEHYGQRLTRQVKQRSLPPQSVKTDESLVSRLVEMWEKFPEEIKTERKQQVAKQKICDWALNMSD